MTKMGGIMTYTGRGDPAVSDFSLAAFSTNGAWQDLDLSSIVPPSAKLVHFWAAVSDDAVNSYIMFRKKGNVNERNVSTLRTQVVNQLVDGDIHVECDSSQIIQYKASNLVFSSIDLTVRGWFG